MTSFQENLLRTAVLLFVVQSATCLIIPEELPTVLSLIYSNIPPIKKGTDSRLGVGFRLGEHADFQVLIELGPQTETDPIASTEAKRRRDAMLTAAMRGELGPFAQAVARYQLEQKLRKEVERLKSIESKQKKSPSDEKKPEKTAASEWLSEWSKGPGGKEVPPQESSSGKNIKRKIDLPGRAKSQEEKILQLSKLYDLQADKKEKK